MATIDLSSLSAPAGFPPAGAYEYPSISGAFAGLNAPITGAELLQAAKRLFAPLAASFAGAALPAGDGAYKYPSVSGRYAGFSQQQANLYAAGPFLNLSSGATSAPMTQRWG